MNWLRPFFCMVSSIFAILLFSTASNADPARAYHQALSLAAQGHDSEAMASLSVLAEAMPAEQSWKPRMLAAYELIRIRESMAYQLEGDRSNPYLNLSRAYVVAHAPPDPESTTAVMIAATLLPGAGHALQGRMDDAMTAALMVVPMLILTLWAAKRRMGPVTLFFALITVGLWSGTVFSAISLVERGSAELYSLWWQGLWQASGLPGRPW